METRSITNNGVEIEANYYLMQVFNSINEQKSSPVFSYKGIKFWREQYEFMTEQEGKSWALGTIADFDEFKNALGLT